MVRDLDLRGTPCPVNLVKSRLALEDLPVNQHLYIYLDRGEPENMVIPSLENEGYTIKIMQIESDWIKVLVSLYVT